MSDEVQVQIDPAVFNDIYIPHLENYARTQIFFGGSSSGKSVFLAQRAVIDVMGGERNYLVCRAVQNTISKSVFNEITKVITDFGVNELFSINKSEFVITCVNGRQILFAGLDDVQKLKSITPKKGALTDIWIEEATETELDSIKQLYKRQRGGDEDVKKRLTLSFNPIFQLHWIFKEWFSTVGWTETQTEYTSPDGSLSIQKTWYIHNKFLTPDDIAGLENEKDKYYYNVYTLGNWGVLGNVIFTNWVIADLMDPEGEYYLPIEQRTNRRNGLDFGFSTDPAAVSMSHYHKSRKLIYIYGEIYETGLTNDILAQRVTAALGSDRVVCDSAEPKSIIELNQHGVSAASARKGKDSVVHGIQWLQQQKIIIDTRCINTQTEFQTYKWKEDAGGAIVKSGGLPVPLDRNNHLIDATRYAYEGDMIETWYTLD